MMSKSSFLLLLFLVFTPSSVLWSADEVSLGEAAEKAGKLREALTHYVSALGSVSEGSADDQSIREKIIQMAQKLDPPPAISKEAKKYMTRGEAAVELATDEAGFQKAAGEFSQAVRLVPWLAEGYFNLGLVQEKAGNITEAIRNLKLYLLAAPDAPDAETVETQIVKLEYKMEEAPKIHAQQQAQEQKSKFESLLGTWTSSAQLYTGMICTGTFALTMKDETSIEGHLTNTFCQNPGYEGVSVNQPTPRLELRGTLRGSDIQWEFWVANDPLGKCKGWGERWQAINLSISVDQRRVSFRGPTTAISSKMECREDFNDYVLTRS